ncbi:hypothetical protein [Aquimarina sp. SS2-1]|uniref:hypothetical protein n=1 Tax=Aquimarina besae TaxID=3342247 RepID=UPI00366E4FFC
MSKEQYDAKVAVLEAITPETVKAPTIPADVYFQEAEDLFVWMQQDQEALVAKGLDWDTYAADLPIRTGASRHAQSVWMSERYTQEEAAKEWNQVSPGAYALRNDLLADFRFAYRKREDLLSRVRAIADGSGDADMIQDLSDLSVLGKANTTELTAINFDLAQLDTVAVRANELADLRAKANGASLDNTKAKDMRDRAFTHLKEAMDEIRATGKYVFRKDTERYKGYISRYK